MEAKNKYCPPQTDILEVALEGVMCQSGGVDMGLDNFVGENRDPWEE